MRATLFPKVLVMGLALGLSAAHCGAQQTQTKESGASHGAATPMTPELKQDMAQMYQKMADCLRTDKSVDQCSHDAMKDCPVVAKTGHCPINEGMGAKMGHAMKPAKGGMGDMDMDNMKGKPPMKGSE